MGSDPVLPDDFTAGIQSAVGPTVGLTPVFSGLQKLKKPQSGSSPSLI